MAKGKYAKKGSGKGGLVLLLIITMLVIGGCVGGILVALNKDKPETDTPPVADTTGGSQQTETVTPPETDGTTAPSTEATTVPTEETTAPTEETTVPTVPETVPETTPTLSEDATVGEQVAQTALAQVGKPYASGGNGPDSFDTSGFLFYCLQQNGLLSKRLKLKQLVLEGTEVAREDLQPGDVVFFWSVNEGQVEYAGIYVGDGKFVAARNEQNPVSEMDFESNYFKTRYLTARRLSN